MTLPVELLAKGLAGLGVISAAVVGGGNVIKNKSKAANAPEEIQNATESNPLDALNEKIKAIGIEDTTCHFKGNATSVTCTLYENTLKAIGFEGKTGKDLTPYYASLSLTIEKGYEGLGFKEGLRFSFSNYDINDVIIGDGSRPIIFKSDTTYDYKIKEEGKLEKAWDLNTMGEIVGMDCKAITECNLITGKINVWKGEGKGKSGLILDSSSVGKRIKVGRDSVGYRWEIKFYVDEEITLKTNSTVPRDYPLNTETSYEIDIKDIDGEKKWVLVDKSVEKLNERIEDVGIKDCELEGHQTKTKVCELIESKVKAIKFSNKTECYKFFVTGLNSNKKLKLIIERDHISSEFPSGLRFTLINKNTSEVTLGSSTDAITLKQDVSYDFKIKDDTQLEKAWTLKSLAEKVGLSCKKNNKITECSLTNNGTINVWKDEDDYIIGAKGDTSKKMTVTRDKRGYQEGFRFEVKDDEINLQGGNKKKEKGGIDKLTKAGKSYGIVVKDIEGIKTWFLVDKTNELNKKIKALGISSDCEFGENATESKECELDEDKLKKINFSNKTGSGLNISGLGSNKKLKLIIERDHISSEFPSGLRFTLINKNTSEVTLGSSTDAITLKQDVSYDFKIKDDTQLEKAWTLKSLAEKVGLSCKKNNKITECSLTNNETINVWKSNSEYIIGAKEDTSKMMKVEEDQKNYLEGFKFSVEKDKEDIEVEKKAEDKTETQKEAEEQSNKKDKKEKNLK